MSMDIIGVVIIQMIIGIFLLVQCRLYFGKKSEAGANIFNVFVPLKHNVIKVALYAAIFLVWFYIRVIVIGGDFKKMDLVCAVILLAELILAIIFDCLPQQICENGVLTHRGFMPWTKVQSVEATEKSEVIQLRVDEKAGYFQQIFCVSGEKQQIQEYVEEHMNYIPEETFAENTEEAVVEATAENIQEAVAETEAEEIVNEEVTEAVVSEVTEEDSVQSEMGYDEISEWNDDISAEQDVEKTEE